MLCRGLAEPLRCSIFPLLAIATPWYIDRWRTLPAKRLLRFLFWFDDFREFFLFIPINAYGAAGGLAVGRVVEGDPVFWERPDCWSTHCSWALVPIGDLLLRLTGIELVPGQIGAQVEGSWSGVNHQKSLAPAGRELDVEGAPGCRSGRRGPSRRRRPPCRARRRSARSLPSLCSPRRSARRCLTRRRSWR
jgi:hypothetical protein